MLLVSAASPSTARVRHMTPMRCLPGHSHVTTADAQAQIYELPALFKYPELLDVYGCTYEHKRSYMLGPTPYGSSSGAGGVSHETLVGSIVAYDEVDNSPCCDHWWVLVRDLGDGHVLRRAPTGAPMRPEPLSVGIGPAVAIVVKRDSSVAWIVETDQEEGKYQFHAIDKSGSRVLASGPNIDPSSLALAGSTLYWTQGGQSFSASLD